MVWLSPTPYCTTGLPSWLWYAGGSPRQNPVGRLEAAILGSYAALSNLVYRGMKAPHPLTVSMKTIIRVEGSQGYLCKTELHLPTHSAVGQSHTTPPLRNTRPLIVGQAGDHHHQTRNATREIMPFNEIKRQYSIPNSFEFKYWQLRHAMRAQFPDTLTLEPDSVERLLTSSEIGKPLSTLYLYLTVAHNVKLNGQMERGHPSIGGG